MVLRRWAWEARGCRTPEFSQGRGNRGRKWAMLADSTFFCSSSQAILLSLVFVGCHPSVALAVDSLMLTCRWDYFDGAIQSQNVPINDVDFMNALGINVFLLWSSLQQCKFYSFSKQGAIFCASSLDEHKPLTGTTIRLCIENCLPYISFSF